MYAASCVQSIRDHRDGLDPLMDVLLLVLRSFRPEMPGLKHNQRTTTARSVASTVQPDHPFSSFAVASGKWSPQTVRVPRVAIS